MSTVTFDPDDPESLPEGRVDYAALDSTTETGLAAQQRADAAETMRDMDPGAGRSGARRGSATTLRSMARRISLAHH